MQTIEREPPSLKSYPDDRQPGGDVFGRNFKEVRLSAARRRGHLAVVKCEAWRVDCTLLPTAVFYRKRPSFFPFCSTISGFSTRWRYSPCCLVWPSGGAILPAKESQGTTELRKSPEQEVLQARSSTRRHRQGATGERARGGRRGWNA